jgi:hypothetical protein
MARKQGFQVDVLIQELKALEKSVRAMVLADQRQWYAEWLDSINDDWAKHDVAHVYKRLQRLGRRKQDLGTGPRPLPRLKVSEDSFACTFEECQQVCQKWGICNGQDPHAIVDQSHMAHARTTELERWAFSPTVQRQGLSCRALGLSIHFPL